MTSMIMHIGFIKTTEDAILIDVYGFPEYVYALLMVDSTARRKPVANVTDSQSTFVTPDSLTKGNISCSYGEFNVLAGFYSEDILPNDDDICGKSVKDAEMVPHKDPGGFGDNAYSRYSFDIVDSTFLQRVENGEIYFIFATNPGEYLQNDGETILFTSRLNIVRAMKVNGKLQIMNPTWSETHVFEIGSYRLAPSRFFADGIYTALFGLLVIIILGIVLFSKYKVWRKTQVTADQNTE